MFKKTLFALFLTFGLILGSYAADNSGIENADTSYAFGQIIGSSLRQYHLKFDYKSFTRGLQDVLENRKTRFSMEKAGKLMTKAASSAHERTARENAAEAKKFLAANGKKPGVTTTASGLQYEVLKAGNGPKPKATDIVMVNYEGTFQSGTVFDRTEPGKPAQFPVDKIIPGWTEALQLMPVGSVYRFFIPPELAYGPEGEPPIPPNSLLIFKVELVSIESPASQAEPGRPGKNR